MTKSRLLPLILLLAAACGGADEPASPSAEGSVVTTPQSPAVTAAPGAQAKPFEVIESATNVSSSAFDGKFYVQWVAVLKNPNVGLFGTFPTVVVTARDAQGVVLGTDDQVLESIPPGATIAFASQILATAQPAKIEIAYKKVD